MARGTPSFCLDRRMYYICLFDLLGDLGMALGTELFPFRREQLFEWSAMGIMTRRTAGEKRRMDTLLLHHFLHVNMAGKTQLASFFDQQGLVVGLVG